MVNCFTLYLTGVVGHTVAHTVHVGIPSLSKVIVAVGSVTLIESLGPLITCTRCYGLVNNHH